MRYFLPKVDEKSRDKGTIARNAPFWVWMFSCFIAKMLPSPLDFNGMRPVC
jgi:hypothetical protein